MKHFRGNSLSNVLICCSIISVSTVDRSQQASAAVEGGGQAINGMGAGGAQSERRFVARREPNSSLLSSNTHQDAERHNALTLRYLLIDYWLLLAFGVSLLLVLVDCSQGASVMRVNII